ncbi:MAG TPA: hypothetical protein VLA00_08705 [Xanthobacteraceae bacterium]|nr:hypothetical protein [Xanthobacteraceae bacterium]
MTHGYCGRAVALVGVLFAAALVAGCQTGSSGSPTARATSGTVPARAIAFESIDGPPPPVFQRLVANLSTEAQERQLAVVSRDTEATYRVRGYLAASVEDGSGTVDWAWDVFDRDRVRVLRVAGTEKTGKGADVWARCDDAVLERIAGRSLDEIASRLDGSSPKRQTIPAAVPAAPEAAPEPIPEGDGPPIASAPAGSPLAFATP